MGTHKAKKDKPVLCIFCGCNIRFEEIEEHIVLVHPDKKRAGKLWIANIRELRRSSQEQLISDQPCAMGDKNNKQQEMREVTLDESGFITSPDFWLENTPSETRHDQHFNYGSSKDGNIIETVDDFKKIALLDKTTKNKAVIAKRANRSKPKALNANKKKINRFLLVACPICDTKLLYYGLFDHISAKHPDQNPKILMAKINRELRGEE